MGFFDDIVHSVGESLAARFPHPPPAIHAAASTMLQALLGNRAAHAKVTDLAYRSPALAELFSHAHGLYTGMPAFWQRAHEYAHHVERGALPHPATPPGARALRAAPPAGALRAIQSHMPLGMMRTAPAPLAPPAHAHDVDGAIEHAQSLLPAPLHAAGRAAHSADGGVPTWYQQGGHASRHGRGWRRVHPHAPEDDRSVWGGPYGWGADYLLDEAEELGDAPPADEGEPEWGEGHATSWMGD